MNYLIEYQDDLDKLVAELFHEAIERVDVRSKSLVQPFKKKVFDFDTTGKKIYLFVGSTPPRKVFQRYQAYGFKTCFVQLAVKSGESIPNKKYEFVDLFFPDIPIQDGLFFGNPIVELIKKNVNAVEDDIQQTRVGIVHGYDKFSVGTIAMLADSCDRSLDIVTIDLANHFLKGLQEIATLNAAIVTSPAGELTAMSLNCPYLRVYQRRLFAKEPTSLLNLLLGKESIQRIWHRNTREISDELKKILQDHQYCAELLSDFQLGKNELKIGPVIRLMVERITDEFDED